MGSEMCIRDKKEGVKHVTLVRVLYDDGETDTDLDLAIEEFEWLENLPRSPVPVAYLWGLTDTVNPIRIPNYVWLTYLNERDVESSFWVLPTAGHYPQREKPEQVERIIRLALDGEVPSRDEENQWMIEYSANRAEEDAIYVGHSNVRKMEFPGAIEYSPDGYSQ